MKKWIIIISFIIYKNEQKNLLSKNKDTMLNRAKEYYENSKELLREKAKKYIQREDYWTKKKT